jgi:hypothetical protein
MGSDKEQLSEAVLAVLGQFPRTLQSEVADSYRLSERLALARDAVIQVSDPKVSFRRSKLLSTIRQWMSTPGAPCTITSLDGREWTLTGDFATSASPTLLNGDLRLELPNFSGVHPDGDVRVKWFDAECQRYGLVDQAADEWREVLTNRVVSDEEVDRIFEEFRLTPSYVEVSIAHHLTGETLELTRLVPTDIRYYDRLVGPIGACTELRPFVGSVIRERTRVSGGEIEGVKRLLLLGAHSSIAPLIDLGALSSGDVNALFEWLLRDGDPISQLTAVEGGLAALEGRPGLADPIARLIHRFISDDPSDTEGRLALLYALVVMVDGVLAGRGVARRRPPFWRRLAAIAHASLLHRLIVASGIKVSEMHRWAMQSSGEFHYVQSLIDLRLEPRWLPEFLSPEQLKHEFISRIVSALQGAAEHLSSCESLKALLDGEPSVISMLKFPDSALCGPLEGGTTSQARIPAEFRAKIEAGLYGDTLTAESFTALINTSLIFSVTGELPQFAAEALRRVKYQVRQMSDGDIAFSLVVGLSIVAAVTRSSELATEIRVLGRVLRRRLPSVVRVSDLVKAAHIAAAAHIDFDAWGQYLGEWLTELALDDIGDEEAGQLLRRVMILCQLEPKLWPQCARAEAALASVVRPG